MCNPFVIILLSQNHYISKICSTSHKDSDVGPKLALTIDK